ncbi:MAG: protein kinase [Burkholderiales bacterium]
MAGPQTLGRYQIERVLGKGAMGVVYEALDPKLHRKVAIKTILISQLDEETAKDFSMRFVREAHAVARLNHPNIVQVYDFGEEGEVAYLVMEFIRGNELKSALAASSTFDRTESVRIMCELLDALDFAHEQGVVHRDIKPANVMLDTQGRVKLTDFGVARVTDADRTNAERTQAGTMVGTPAYMSPEQIQGHRVDRRSDIFSAGIILYQFLTGQKPFTGDGAWTVAKKIIQDEPPTPSSLNVSVTPQLDRVVAKALAKQPEDRYPTAREFAGALRSAAEGKAVDQSSEPTVIVPREAETPQALRSGEMELEFWRSVKDSDDPNDFELYLKQFPNGVYASLAGRRVARLRGLPVEGGGEASDTRQPPRTEVTGSQGRFARDETAPTVKLGAERSVVERTLKLAGTQASAPAREAEARPATHGKRSSILVPAVLGLLAAAGVAAYFATRPGVQPPVAAAPGVEAAGKIKEDEARAKREAEARTQQEAAEKARSEAELQARREAEARTQRESQARAEREAGQRAQREAELRAKAEAELQAQREAEARTRSAAEASKREAALRARREAEATAKREAEVRARRDSEVKAKREAEAKAQAETRARLAAESSFWDSIKNSKTAADYQKYLDQYPRGRYADLARKQIAALEKARLEEARRVEAEKVKADTQKRTEEERARAATREADAAKRKNAAAKNRSTIVPPTF